VRGLEAHGEDGAEHDTGYPWKLAQRIPTVTRAALYCGDALAVLKTLPAESVQCCVTSPPYWGLRDYGVTGQLGLEGTPEGYVQNMVDVFGWVRRVLRDDGILWLNLGDSYAGSWGAQSRPNGNDLKSNLEGGSPLSARQIAAHPKETQTGSLKNTPGMKAKDLIGLPWRVAFALQADGWWLRSDIIWSKPNPMPESVTDRPTKAHEYVFLLSKSATYYYDADAIAEEAEYREDARAFGEAGGARHGDEGRTYRPSVKRGGFNGKTNALSGREAFRAFRMTRNARTVWDIATQPYAQAHFATFPEELARRCILAGSRPGDHVLDPFGGSGTVAQVATGNGRESIYIDLNPAYVELAKQRIGPMFCDEVGGLTRGA
jgi:DNA modification methylase